MKILKIVLILLVPALGFVSCQKSNVKPNCSESKTEATNNNSSSKFNSVSAQEDQIDPISTDIIGSGDDDRDGGDKKKKAKVQ